MALLIFMLVPIIYLIGLVLLYATGRRRGIWVSLVFFALAMGVGLWAIFQSRSSTAGIGVLFLPFLGVLAGVLGWLFRNLQIAKHFALRVLGWLCLAGAIALLAWGVYDGLKTIKLNQTRDAAQQARSTRIDGHRAAIKTLLAQNKGREPATLEKIIVEANNDDEILIPALASEYVSADTLDRFARADDLSVTLTAVRNPNCRAETLVRIFRTHSYPDYFFQALAAHPNTPPVILREMYQKNPRTIMGLDIWFAKNPATPDDMLLELTDTRDPNVIQSLLQNPKVDCNMHGRIDNALKRSSRPDDSYSIGRLSDLRKTLCGTSAQPDSRITVTPPPNKETP